MSEKKYILSSVEAQQKLKRMSLEIAESLSGHEGPILLIGVQNSGVVIAEAIGSLLRPFLDKKIDIISVRLNKHLPEKVELSVSIPLNGVNIILIDDVTNSGKTLLYALKPLLDWHPRTIQTLVLVERMHKLYPVKPDFVGLSISTTLEEHIQVETIDGKIVGAYVV
ncbi:phosphoribosyltransferase family protein [Sediminibacterium sp.]|uniref:phosphoribosyltransferase family protein n=1 Tax=Sediminibacterium sp. TaxID=1917865 RepID=UPI0025CCC15D|nr:phosphoribosyltransferase family protein [Sediminibacterium sp.]MBT9483220.1 phosphoribosyltransferase [Sediminibacterium sp.]